ncbi:MAG: malto-oligosyltrehalose trehalohydrolase [Candidatus Tectomicrobia bacterium]|uniref:Malto-oligosyltrehalose trehalohydrolase n=1 Tax=Tectimicrobiota bacterium TaxID=2528274 RepID=A0A932G219_UNCTE|nr:malto-oligosyltrehalose trehalohydrolase [Candidatus Tectomicrobia bacterium]
MRIGAHYLGEGRGEFVLWAPFKKEMALRIVSPEERALPMEEGDRGYWHVVAEGIHPGALYLYRLDGTLERPDPASSCQPQGVHGPSQLVDHGAFPWAEEGWAGIPLPEMILYELHVGTFTPEGTFEAILPRLDALKELGINTLELMPVAQFPGERNWGYDGVYPFAVQDSYGGPEGLKRLVSACHQRGMAVVLDVIFNHLGPEGNYLMDFGPYFIEKYKTPWGQALNFDEAYSDEVRNFFLENALSWFQHYHLDALRLDAIHAIHDMSARPFLEELTEKVETFSHQQGRQFSLMAESDLNDVRVIRPRELGGYGMDLQWNDDFHHALHGLLTGETTGYYLDFGGIGHLVKAFKEGFVYSWQYSAYRKRHHGSSSADRPAHQFVVFSQNHDQTGNRMLGERLSQLVSFEALKLAAGVVLLSPYLPLLFMGEEYGEESPFLYFVSHSDAPLIAGVREGRKEEFQAFRWQGEPPDPQNLETFLQSKLRWEERTQGKHQILLALYRQLIQLRREIPALGNLDKGCLEVSGLEEERLLFLRRWHSESQVFCAMNFHPRERTFHPHLPPGRWKKRMDSSEETWMGPGPSLPEAIADGQAVTLNPLSFVLYEMEES